jgi:hypothetical protein
VESQESLEDQVRRLHETIAHFERLLREGASGDLAETYRAEIVAARAMLDDMEHRSPR